MPKTILNEFLTLLSMSPEFGARIHSHIMGDAPFNADQEVARAKLAFEVQTQQVTPVWLDLVPELKGARATAPEHLDVLYEATHRVFHEVTGVTLDSAAMGSAMGIVLHRSPSSSPDYEGWIARLSGEIQEDALLRAVRRADVPRGAVDMKAFEQAAEISWMCAAIALHRMEADAPVLSSGYRSSQRIPELRVYTIKTWEALEGFVKAAVAL